MTSRVPQPSCRAPAEPSAPAREDGVVLILILTLLVLTISAVYSFARTAFLEVRSSRQREALVRADLLAESGLRIAERTLIEDLLAAADPLVATTETPRDPWELLSQTPIELPNENGVLHVRVEDSGGKINLNALVDAEGLPRDDSQPFLVSALERIVGDLPGREEDKPYEIEDLAEGILDWLDTDDLTGMGDDEADHYGRQGASASPLDRPLFTLDELDGVPGLDGLLLEALKAYFSAQPMFPPIEKSGVNLNTAPPHVLGLIYGGSALEKELLGNDEVFRILKARDEGKIFCREIGDDELCTTFPQEVGLLPEVTFPPLQYQSDVFRIRSEARIREARACITAIVDRSDPAEIRTLYYRKGC
ncbi:MAG: general secretion pathway protein GspK [Myxococcota bacterium]